MAAARQRAVGMRAAAGGVGAAAAPQGPARVGSPPALLTAAAAARRCGGVRVIDYRTITAPRRRPALL
eukprot:COSAG01_NODE_2087_length_8456_cov_2.656456_9_plen_68_part_00